MGPEYGCERISDLLARGPALQASPNAVARVLMEAGYGPHASRSAALVLEVLRADIGSYPILEEG